MPVMKAKFSLTLLFIVLIGFKPGLAALEQGSGDNPNIIFIMADDLGWGDVGFNGQTKIKTPHIDQLAKEGAAKVMIKPAAHGTGVLAGGSMRSILEAAGYTDILAKSQGSANPHNVVKATFNALALLREPIQVAKQRNINLKKVFNG